MIEKKIGATLLIAGTCIGSGMVALPMVLAKIGLVPSILFMLFIWSIMYYTSLINVELNLQAGHGRALGSLGRYFSGRTAEFIGVVSLKLLSYSLLAVFLYGGSSVLQHLLASSFKQEHTFDQIAFCYAVVAFALLLLPIRLIDYINRFFFIGLLAIFLILIIGLALSINWQNLPLLSEQASNISAWTILIPVVFTSFGFQVIFHTLTNYCQRDAKMLKQAFFWGSLIPAIVYILWTSSILSVIYHNNPIFYHQMASGQVEVGELISVLSGIAHWQSVQLLVWWISLLAIATSVLGVGIGLCDALQGMMANRLRHSFLRKLIAAFLTILPAFLVVIFVPNAFIAVLGFSGMILAIIAILLPIYLFTKVKKNPLHYPELRHTGLILLSLIVGFIVIASEIYNMT